MEALTQQGCYNHPSREAVARCPECHQFFCRECVTEHDDRMLCSRCLSQQAAAVSPRSHRWRAVLANPVQALMGFLILWYLFFLLGQTLLAIPHTFHEGTVWQAEWWNLP